MTWSLEQLAFGSILTLSLCACAAASEPSLHPPAAPAPAPAPAPPPRAEAAETPATIVLASATAPVDPTCKQSPLCQGESCCTRLFVPAGTYADKKAGQVHVGDFYLDKYELTVGRVRAWVDAGSPAPAPGTVLGKDSNGRDVRWSAQWKVMSEARLHGWERYDTWRVGQVDLPKNFIDWYTSAAVCAFAGGRLPDDAEWHYAAAGGDENRMFPWGSAPQTPERAVYNCMGDGNQSCSLKDVLAVGSRPLGAGRWGHMDLAGSMFEWTMDGIDDEGTVARGGGFCYIGGIDRRSKPISTVDNARRDPPASVSHMVGARCAYDVASTNHVASAQ
ncbi:serine/threonine protein kinase [Minicystis rosea]|nr:serine/threonine protein kinase [Minicystis rosea]